MLLAINELQTADEFTMRVAIMQPYLFPYIGYWQLLDAVDTFVIYDDVNFKKKSYINRNLMLVNGVSYQFTLELVKASQNKLINEIEIGGNREKLLRTIEMSYRKSPYFTSVFPVLSESLGNSENNLARYIGDSLKSVSGYLDMDVTFIYSSDICKNTNLSGQDRIIEIIKKMDANNYVNAIGGRSLYDADTFEKENISLHFVLSEITEYDQFGIKFVPNLSIIDVMMFNSIGGIKKMLTRYVLI